jgi:hypothetical protein
MSEGMVYSASSGDDANLQAWIKDRLQQAVVELGERGVVDSLLVEAKPEWVLPNTLLIGRIRERGRKTGFDWFICGDAPLTHAEHTVASTPREAARHFSLQWQLKAARESNSGDELAQRAEALYELVEDDRFWDDSDSGAAA